ncbi:tetratricopeptide repeat protein [Sulfitobacter aestuarii]|uniref:Tetratricopeptide repeat protein n=1 Tax=Sulfitobacter aestuarii TaxID=2161676 RepID=A0ABW5U200_9RHOB
MQRITIKTGGLVFALLGAVSMPMSLIAAGVDFPTTCSTNADAEVDDGLTLLHNMMYIEAEAAFGRAAEADPDCAMAQWGIAMANFHPLWPGTPSDDEKARGTAAAERLANMTPGSDLEQAFANAVAAFYASDHADYRARLAAWAKAQQAAQEKIPENIDAAALSALARLATAPSGPDRIEENARVGDVLDVLHKTAPDHPGVIHYAIHAYDNPPLKDRGLPYAEIYDTAAPAAAHALHMPAHIFTRTGDWLKSIDLNRRSAEAALGTSQDVVQTHYVHAIDYMVYGHLQMGDIAKAERLVDEMLAIDNHQVSFGGAYALAASPVRLLLEQGQWAEAAALSPAMHATIPWENFPQAAAMLWFAKGLGAARTNDIATARAAASELTRLHDSMQKQGQDYWARLTEGQLLTVEGWMELAEGNNEVALAQQKKAADLEDEIGKSPVTPGHVLPARELLGDMLSELGRTEEADEAYRATLAHSPNRARSLAALNR